MENFKAHGRITRAKKAKDDFDKIFNRITKLIKEEVVFCHTTKDNLDRLYKGLEVFTELQKAIKQDIVRMEGNEVLYRDPVKVKRPAA